MTKAELQAKIAALKQNTIIVDAANNIEGKQALYTTDTQPIYNEADKGKYKLISITILWSESGRVEDNKAFTNWADFQKIMTKISQDHEGLGYIKTKVCILWQNGYTITDRIDCSNSNGDYFAERESIGDYLKRQTSVMYESNLQDDSRFLLQWQDETKQTNLTLQESKSGTVTIPQLLNQLLGIIETIEEANDSSEVALIKASEQVEKCEAYIAYLQAILPILKAKTNKLIEIKHKPNTIEISNTKNYTLN